MSLDIDLIEERPCEVYTANMTHNVGEMAKKAGLKDVLWYPEKAGILYAGDLIEPLKRGIEKMEAEPDFFRQFDAPNGWGTYDQFLPWLKTLYSKCEEFPNAKVQVSI